MTKKVLLLLALISLFSCKNEECEEPDTNDYNQEGALPCFSCDNEKVSEIYKDVDAVVTSTWHDPIKGIENTHVFTISKADLERVNGLYTLNQDSILVPCKEIPQGFKVIGKKVKISGQLMSCGKLLSCPFCRFLYGRKFILTKIK
jgi:hypothetical protein